MAIFYPSGPGPMWDMPDNATSITLIEAFVKADKPIGVVCHAPVALINVRQNDGKYLIQGKRVTGFCERGRKYCRPERLRPFLLEDRLKDRGGVYSKGANWTSYVQVDGKLVTGHTPAHRDPQPKRC